MDTGAADVGFEGGAGSGEVGGEVAHGDGFFEGGGEGAGSDAADLGVVGEEEGTFAGDAFAGEFEADAFGAVGALFDFSEGLLADEGGFVEFDREAETCGVGIDTFVHLVAVEGHGGFESEGITAAETAGEDAVRGTGLHQDFPELNPVVGGDDDFETVFAGVSGAADEE